MAESPIKQRHTFLPYFLDVLLNLFMLAKLFIQSVFIQIRFSTQTKSQQIDELTNALFFWLFFRFLFGFATALTCERNSSVF